MNKEEGISQNIKRIVCKKLDKIAISITKTSRVSCLYLGQYEDSIWNNKEKLKTLIASSNLENVKVINQKLNQAMYKRSRNYRWYVPINEYSIKQFDKLLKDFFY